jgi:hypothetical protein
MVYYGLRARSGQWRILLQQSGIHSFLNFSSNVVNLSGYKWNKTVSNRIRYASNIICNVSDEMCNTCATSYINADNSKPMAYLILKLYVNKRIKTDLSKSDAYFVPKIKFYIV